MKEQEYQDLYDDSESVAFIRKEIVSEHGQEFLKGITDDDIVYLIDVIYDYFDSRGLLGGEEDEDDAPIEIDLDDLVDYAEKSIKNNGMGPFSRELIEAVVQAENDFTDQLDERM